MQLNEHERMLIIRGHENMLSKREEDDLLKLAKKALYQEMPEKHHAYLRFVEERPEVCTTPEFAGGEPQDDAELHRRVTRLHALRAQEARGELSRKLFLRDYHPVLWNTRGLEMLYEMESPDYQSAEAQDVHANA